MRGPTVLGSKQLKQPIRYTTEDYRSWDDGLRWKLINGEAYAMSPAPMRKHQKLADEGIRRAHGVRGYWFVSPENGGVLAYILADKRFLPVRKFRADRIRLGAQDSGTRGCVAKISSVCGVSAAQFSTAR